MNAIFLFLFIVCGSAVLFTDPELFLTTVLEGASSAASLCIALLASYAVWLGLMQVWEESGLTRRVSRLVKPLAKKLFHKRFHAGIGSAATPYGIEAVKLLDKSPRAEYASCMFFALNATSIQLIPTSVVGVRAALGSGAPTDIILPTILTTALTTLLACTLVWLFIGKPFTKNKGVCTR